MIASQIGGNRLLNYVNLETLRKLPFWGIPAKLVTAACKIVLVNKIRNLDFHVKQLIFCFTVTQRAIQLKFSG